MERAVAGALRFSPPGRYRAAATSLNPMLVRRVRTAGPLAAAFLLLLAGDAAAQVVDALEARYRRLDPAIVSDLVDDGGACVDAVGSFWSVLQALAAEERAQARLQGSAAFSLSADEAGDDDLYKASAAASVGRGTYPSEVEVRSSVGVTLRNSEFQENVSDLGISYDYHLGLPVEAFAFVERSTDDFLGIDQRYEIGGGTVFQLWRGQTRRGRVQRAVLRGAPAAVAARAPRTWEADTLRMPYFAEGPVRGQPWLTCWARATGKDVEDGAFLDAAGGDAETLRAAWHRAEQARRKRFARLRLGLLVSLFAELERASPTDSVRADPLGALAPLTLDLADERFRLGLRPTLDVRLSDRWRFSLRPYLKLPMPWERHDEVATAGLPDAVPLADGSPFALADASDRALDFRFDGTASMSVSLTDAEPFRRGSFELVASYRFLYDNAPPRAYVVSFRDPAALAYRLVEAEDAHHIVNLAVRVAWGG